MTYRGLMFDLDGTLLDTGELIIKSFQHTMAVHHNRPADLALIRAHFGKPLRSALAAMGPNVEEMAATYREYNLAHHDELAGVFAGVVETVRELYNRGIRLAIVTSKTRKTAVRGLRLFDLDKYFPVVIGNEDCSRHKPDPEPVLLALAALGLPVADCLMVGDSPHDLASAHAAGLKAAAVRWSEVPWADVLAAKPDHIVETMADLLALCPPAG